ncbi:hypothetical protein EV426DRAFT_572079 [Tirmania nivea]|nr:hypothetical protein EV426DRAFT_572079 [Tirmania nivea]
MIRKELEEHSTHCGRAGLRAVSYRSAVSGEKWWQGATKSRKRFQITTLSNVQQVAVLAPLSRATVQQYLQYETELEYPQLLRISQKRLRYPMPPNNPMARISYLTQDVKEGKPWRDENETRSFAYCLAASTQSVFVFHGHVCLRLSRMVKPSQQGYLLRARLPVTEDCQNREGIPVRLATLISSISNSEDGKLHKQRARLRLPRGTISDSLQVHCRTHFSPRHLDDHRSFAAHHDVDCDYSRTPYTSSSPKLSFSQSP